MIIVTVEHEPDLFGTVDILDLRDSVEAIVGLIFAEELHHVDVRIRPFGPYDQYEEPLFFTIDVDERELLGEARSLGRQFCVHMGTHLASMFSHNIPFRVWVRRITGSYTETGHSNP